MNDNRFAPLKCLYTEEILQLTSLVEKKLFAPENDADEILKLTALLAELRALVPAPPSGFGVHFIEHGPQKIAVIKAIRGAIPGTGLREAKEMSEGTRPFPKDGLSREKAEHIVREIVVNGGRAEVTGTVAHHELYLDNGSEQ